MSTLEAVEVVEAVEPRIESLIDEHKERRKHWYAHELIPWELGRSFAEDPWDESQATVSPEVRTALCLNLLTEDNLPYYHARIAGSFGPESPMAEWSRMWTAEEAQHSIAMRAYLLASRNCDPKALEDDRVSTMTRGWDTDYTNAIDLFVYTSAQELATRISHRNAGALADDETAHRLMTRVAVDENHHFLFYRGVTTEMLKQAPSQVVAAVYRVMSSFEMPGTGIPNFRRKAVEMARIGIYSVRIHAEQVVKPLLRDWDIGSLVGLTTEAAEAQDRLMSMPGEMIKVAEAFERRMSRRSKRAR